MRSKLTKVIFYVFSLYFSRIFRLYFSFFLILNCFIAKVFSLYFSRKIKKKVSYGGKICCIFLVFSLYFLEKYKVLRNTANQRHFWCWEWYFAHFRFRKSHLVQLFIGSAATRIQRGWKGPLKRVLKRDPFGSLWILIAIWGLAVRSGFNIFDIFKE